MLRNKGLLINFLRLKNKSIYYFCFTAIFLFANIFYYFVFLLCLEQWLEEHRFLIHVLLLI